MKYGIDTRCQHLADDNKDEIYGAISYPIYQSATFARDRVGGGSGYDYSRLQNPTREHLEKIVASLEERKTWKAGKAVCRGWKKYVRFH